MARVRHGEYELPDFAVPTSSSTLQLQQNEKTWVDARVPNHQNDVTWVDTRLAEEFLPTVMLSETMEQDIAALERAGLDFTPPPPPPKKKEAIARRDDIVHLLATVLLLVVAGVSAFFITTAIADDPQQAPSRDR